MNTSDKVHWKLGHYADKQKENAELFHTFGDDCNTIESEPAQRDTAQHSPLPWHIESEAANLTPRIKSGAIAVARCVDAGKQTGANAAYIVKACNAYPHAERLAEALKAMRRELAACARDCMTEAKAMRWIDDNEADIAAREALAQWEEVQK